MKSKLTILIVVLMSFSINMVGQKSEPRLSLGPKAGVYLTKNGGLVAGLDISIYKDRYVFSVDFNRFKEFEIFGSQDDNYSQIGFMFGVYDESQSKNEKIQLQGGFAPLWGTKKTDVIAARNNNFFDPFTYETKDVFTVGAVLKMSIKLLALDNIGVGFDFQLNINRDITNFMVMIGIDFGDLKSPKETRSWLY